MKTGLRAFFAASILVSFFAAAEAQSVGDACHADAQTYCASMQGDAQKLQSCLEDNYKKVSDACYSALKSAAASEDQKPGDAQNGAGGESGQGRWGHHGGGMRGACREDVKSFCQGVQPGGGRIISCLKDHDKDISETCRDALQKMGARRHGGPGAQSGGGDAAPQQ